jgi:hypothetical protein
MREVATGEVYDVFKEAEPSVVEAGQQAEEPPWCSLQAAGRIMLIFTLAASAIAGIVLMAIGRG